MEIYLVGGAVRDRLLGLPVKERDWVVVGATPRQMLDLGYTRIGKDFPVFLHPQTKEEYALARTERKTGPGYTGFDFHAAPEVSLEADLGRRDLTINAMAESATGELIDPYDGQSDLDLGRLRHISPAFAEDPVRILRVARFAARFAQWGFSVAHTTNALMRSMVAAGEVDHLVAERVWAELARALSYANPEKFFSVLHGCHALAVLFPEIEADYASDTTPHGGDELPVCLQTLRQCAAASPNTCVRFAALLLASGTALTTEQRLANCMALCQRYRVPNDYARLASIAIRTAAAILDNNADILVGVMEAAGAFGNASRWPELLELFVAIGRIDNDRAQQLQTAQQQAATINAASVDDLSLAGPAIGAAIRDKRIETVHRVMST
jgi:tRNA nucleotidyltransferase (CCA-adding enzyme)